MKIKLKKKLKKTLNLNTCMTHMIGSYINLYARYIGFEKKGINIHINMIVVDLEVYVKH